MHLEELQHGKKKRRNPILSEHAAHLLPYRALQAWPQIELQDHRSGDEFRAVVAQPQVGMQSITPVAPPRSHSFVASLAGSCGPPGIDAGTGPQR